MFTSSDNPILDADYVDIPRHLVFAGVCEVNMGTTEDDFDGDVEDDCDDLVRSLGAVKVNVANMVGDLHKLAIIPVETALTKFHNLDTRWDLIRENCIFWSDDEDDDDLTVACDGAPGSSQPSPCPPPSSSSSPLTHSLQTAATQASVSSIGDEVTVPPDSIFFQEVINKM